MINKIIALSLAGFFSSPLSSQAVEIRSPKISSKVLQQTKNIKAGPTILLSKSDSDAVRLAKAAMVIPSPRQLAWQEMEFTCFIHFGINTFTGREWGNGKEKPELFNPSKVNTDQWCKTARAAGMKMILITMKHHDGFCLWQTRYNDDFSVRNSPWKNGKGDVLKQLSASCKKYGLKLGVYLSPADLYQIENKKGHYGNGSKYRDTIIPTDPASFKSNPMKGRKPPKGKPTFKFKLDDYNRYMLNQLYECLTEYGRIDEVWFDGAHPKRKGNQTYTKKFWFDMISALAPHATVAIAGPDVRWCGNEHGGTRRAEWSPVPLNGNPEVRATWKYIRGNPKTQDLGSRKKIKDASFLRWWPSEVDTSIRHGWFWRNERQHVRSAEEVYGIYERSVGSNALLLLNIPPNRDGVFAEKDSKVLRQVGKRIRLTYGRKAAKLTQKGADVFTFDKPATINRIVIQEEIATHGQRVEKHAVDAWVNGQWQEIAQAETIGYKRILRIPDVTTSKIRLRIIAQRLQAKLSRISVHYDLAPLQTPTVQRDREGNVSIKGTGEIFYSLNGKTPNRKTTRYSGSFALPKGGVLKAVAVRGKEKSEVLTKRFDIAKTKWKIHAVSSENRKSRAGAEKAIDGNPKTLWHSKWSGGTDPMPHSISIDLGERLTLKGFTYLPRIGAKGGILDQYRFEVSKNGRTWIKASQGRFDNIKNDPTIREIRFVKKYKGIRYVRLTGIHSIEGKPHSSAAEIGVITR